MAVTGRTTMAKYAGIDLSYSQEKVDYKALAKAKIMGKPLKFVMITGAMPNPLRRRVLKQTGCWNSFVDLR